MTMHRRHNSRGQTRTSWLHSAHTFSFGGYRDPDHMGFGPLRVINDDRVQPGAGFAPHGHRDMEIISYVVEGQLAHEDSLGHGSVIRAGDVQRMTAGSGIQHSEFNASQTEPVRFLQIWVIPKRAGLTPGYEEKHFPIEVRRGHWRVLATPDGRDGSLTLHQDVSMWGILLQPGEHTAYRVEPQRRAWVQVVRGQGHHGGMLEVVEGDGLALESGEQLQLKADTPLEVLLFDVPAPH